MPRGRKLTEQEEAEAVACYLKGISLKSIAGCLGVSQTQIWRVMDRAGARRSPEEAARQSFERSLHPSVGQRFGKRTVLRIGHYNSRRRSQYYVCRCDCGALSEVCGRSLISGEAGCCTSCQHATHGATRNKARPTEYSIWTDIKKRCLNPRHRAYKNYGGRGITICAEWLDFETFRRDMGPRPSDRHEIDRIDNDGPYARSNCRWVTRKQQMSNTRVTVFLEWNGQRKSLSDWSEETGINQSALYQRLRKLNWPVERALTEPINK